MAEYIVMPKLGFDMREGVLNNWLKKVGESINKGEVVAEIESDKATLELEAQVAGTLLHLLHGPGDVVPIGANLAIVGQPGEDVSALTGGNGAADSYPPTPTPPPAPEAIAKPGDAAPKEVLAAAENAPPAPEAAAPAEAATPDETYPGGVKATPVARRLAEEKKIDLLHVTGSGPDGRVTKADVEAFAAAPPPAQPPAAPQPAAKPAPTAAVLSLIHI